MSEEEIYEANHGEWVLGARANNEKYALFSFQGRSVQALEIEDLQLTTSRQRGPNERRGDRYTINGKVLGPGHPFYDTHVGREAPVYGHRNPISYLPDG